MVKAHCVVIIAQVDMNLIVVCERIMELQPVKENESDDDDDERIIDFNGGWCQLLTLFWRSLSGHIIIFCIVLAH